MKMNANILKSPREIVLEERDVEVCCDNDAILKNRVSSICGSDVSAYKHGGAVYQIP